MTQLLYLLAQFSLYVHKGGLKPDSFHFYNYFNLVQTSKATMTVGCVQVLKFEFSPT